MDRRFSEEARELEDELKSSDEIKDALRGSREQEQALLDRGWHEERCGISVKSRSQWMEHREEVVDTHTFDFLLFDIIEAELVFYKHYHGYEFDEAFIQDVLDEKVGLEPCRNVVETFVWLRDDIEAPTTHKSEQRGLGDFCDN